MLKSIIHSPVLLEEIVDFMPENSKIYYDGTLWHGGHAKSILVKNENISLFGIDRDNLMLEKAKNNLSDLKNEKHFYHWSYADIEKYGDNIDYMLLDLWVNMEHFQDYERGFSIRGDGALDMRFDKTNPITAKSIIDTYSPDMLAKVFEKFGNFSPNAALRLGTAIVKNKKEIVSTYKLKEVLSGERMGIKRIIVIFQALRIEVNKELDELERFLEKFGKYLVKWWRCSIISYHSIEDRIVKYALKWLHQNGFKLLTKHVVKPKWDEVKNNRAARSAKLRVIEKL